MGLERKWEDGGWKETFFIITIFMNVSYFTSSILKVLTFEKEETQCFDVKFY
ncbi:MAG TPA: hypothetical protein VD908_09520 [Cytophagales bacterium]|nr:hypothetical protein [Cytophagales bacterium]